MKRYPKSTCADDMSAEEVADCEEQMRLYGRLLVQRQGVRMSTQFPHLTKHRIPKFYDRFITKHETSPSMKQNKRPIQPIDVNDESLTERSRLSAIYAQNEAYKQYKQARRAYNDKYLPYKDFFTTGGKSSFPHESED